MPESDLAYLGGEVTLLLELGDDLPSYDGPNA